MTLLAPLQAIGDTIHRRMCPLYSFDDGGRIHMVGSAVPFTSGNVSFLITAAHVCLDRRKQVIPLFTWGTDGPRVLRQQRLAWEYKPNQTPDPDIALIALSEDDVADLSGRYQFSYPGTVTTTKAVTPGVHYLLAGYPSVRNRVKSRHFSPPALATYLVTGNIQSVAGLNLNDKTDAHHFALCFKGDEVRSVSGDPFRVPKPQGMSGGGVWRLDIDVLSKLATTPLLVGIGIEYYKPDQIFVVSRIQNAIPLAHDLVHLLSGVTPRDILTLEEVRANDA